MAGILVGSMPDKVTAPQIRGYKSKGQRIVSITAYDYPSGLIADEAGVDIVLVGDSVGNVLLGFDDTIPVTLDQMEHHVRATSSAVQRALLVADLPFGSYQSSVGQAVDSAIRLVKAGASAIKLEGSYTEQIAAIVRAGVPVMGHVGMTPQSVHAFGGFRVQGKDEKGEAILQEAIAIESSGAFAVVLELVPEELSRRITERLSIPTIGIGAGSACDGQIQVFHDALGFSTQTLKHVKRYADARSVLTDGLRRYAEEVRAGLFQSGE